MRLINETTGQEIKVGDTVETFRGDKVVVTGYQAPHKPSSTGRVYTKAAEGAEFTSEFFPSVIGAKIVEHNTDGERVF